ncbi:hypothetical protein [Methanococcoides vulcani]|uniref:hypothetical protein n=1 Tax=Methanococcoides vulcani TaxID=1353158 RepID=UPI00143854D3|nr:hypothetical protein [Methanococcoides vulcani]
MEIDELVNIADTFATDVSSFMELRSKSLKHIIPQAFTPSLRWLLTISACS